MRGQELVVNRKGEKTVGWGVGEMVSFDPCFSYFLYLPKHVYSWNYRVPLMNSLLDEGE